MKKFLILFLCLCAVNVFAQDFKSDYATYTLSVAGVLSDTTSSTSPFLSREIMGYKVFCADTSGDDSVNQKVYFETCSDYVNLQDWVLIDSLTVTSDSSWNNIKNITTVAVIPDSYCRFRAVGQAGNKQESTVITRVRKVFKYLR